MRIHIIGASGSGKTTLGHELVAEKGGHMPVEPRAVVEKQLALLKG